MVVAVANTLRKNLNAPSLTLLTMELLKSGGVQVSLWWGHAEEVETYPRAISRSVSQQRNHLGT